MNSQLATRHDSFLPTNNEFIYFRSQSTDAGIAVILAAAKYFRQPYKDIDVVVRVSDPGKNITDPDPDPT